MGVQAAATVLLAGVGGVAAVASLYLLTLAVAAFFPRTPETGGSHRTRLTVIVPAHNEEELLSRCIASLQAQTYADDLYRIVVVADNCTDSTAAVARAAGAEVLVRHQPDARGKGQALRWAFDRVLAEPVAPGAVVIVDADSVADPGLLAGLEARLAAGAEVVQAEYLVLDEPGTGSELRQAAFLLFHRARFTGRDVLGMACNLVGNGMLFARPVLERVAWNAFTGTEDLEYSIDLRMAGIKPRFAAAARVWGPAPGRGRAADTQRSRWEGGRFHLMRSRLGPLVTTAFRHRDWSLLDAAADLSVPPLGLLLLLTAGGAMLAAGGWTFGITAPWALVPWATAAIAMVLYVVLGLRAARAPASAYRALLAAPGFLLAKVGGYSRMARGLESGRWERTERPGEAGRRAGNRVDVCGVPIDVVDQSAATERLMEAVATGSFVQVTTVNLQFLVTARRRPPVRRMLAEAGLSVADGAPVVWLARILGRRLPGRVAGVDLVSALMALAAQRHARVFLLGGSRGAAAQAAAVLTRRLPNLQITGTLEPPVCSLRDLDDEAILARIGDAGAEILLVALGHPKQDLWIARNRDRLPVAVAIGVGCTFDLITGRSSRAPIWIRRTGFEWLYRVIHEPLRLGARYVSCALWLVGVLLPLAVWRRLRDGRAIGIPVFAPPPPAEVAGPAAERWSSSPS